jgi:NADH:ubiquinone oxidoreductase subunit 3 (subunit A)
MFNFVIRVNWLMLYSDRDYSPRFKNKGSNPFSRVFSGSLLFLLFDLEITLLFPFAVSKSLIGMYGLIIVLIFMVIITIGVYIRNR